MVTNRTIAADSTVAGDLALLRRMFDAAAVGMALVGAGSRVQFGNPAFTRLLDLTPAELAGRTIDALVHPECTAQLVLHLRRLLIGETTGYRGECRLKGPGGKDIWVLAQASLLDPPGNGGPARIVLQVTDIDAAKRAHAALGYAESRWRHALDAARQGVWEHDRRTDGMFYSRMWRDMRGFRSDEPIDGSQEAWLARVHPDDVPRILSDVEKQDTGEDGYDTLEYRERSRDGRWIWILSRGRPVEWDEAGQPVRTIGTDTDITHRKLVEAELANEKELLKVTLESIGDGVIATDAARRVTFVNAVAERLTGWSLKEAMGRPVEEVFPVADLTHPVATCLTTGSVSYLDEDGVLAPRQGGRRDIRSSAAPLRTPDGRLIGAVLVFQDVSTSRALQRQLAHSATHDPLTNLPNRAAFEEALETVVGQALVERRTHALCYIDLDFFKPVNDMAGHAAGDALLRQVADVIASCCRPHDFAARIGGDEFAVLLVDCGMAAARRVAARIAQAIAAIDFEAGGQRFRIGASIGISRIGEVGCDGEELKRRADAACYRAKAEGRGRVVCDGDPVA